MRTKCHTNRVLALPWRTHCLRGRAYANKPVKPVVPIWYGVGSEKFAQLRMERAPAGVSEVLIPRLSHPDFVTRNCAAWPHKVYYIGIACSRLKVIANA